MQDDPSAMRFEDPGIKTLFTQDARWQSWIDVEVALAQAEAELGMIPVDAARVIAEHGQLALLDRERIAQGLLRTGHPLVPLIWEFSRVVGEEAGGYVHWGATTQNIIDTGEALLLRQAHGILLRQLGDLLKSLADLAERSKDMVVAGRTHGQHAVPATFGYKVAVWIDELVRNVERLRELEKRVFAAMLGGAAGTFASFGVQGVEVQTRLAELLDLLPMPVPSRTHRDRQAEYVTTLALLAGACGKIAFEVYTMMKQEFGEVEEPVPAGTVGSSTMPQKRNPILSQDVMSGSAYIRSLVPLALEAILTEHEANRATTTMMRHALEPACVQMGDNLARLNMIANGIELKPERMRRNVDLSGGMILAEAIMLKLGENLGRQEAHDVIYDIAQGVSVDGGAFDERLMRNPEVQAVMSVEELNAMLDPAKYTGLCGAMALEQAAIARRVSSELCG